MEQDRSVPLFLLFTGFLFFLYSAKYSIGTLTSPGVGFFPILISAGLIGLSGVFLWQNHHFRIVPRGSSAKEQSGEESGAIWGGKVYGVVAVFIAFAGLHSFLGFWVSVAGAMAALLWIAGVPSWKHAFLGGGITAAVSYLVFEYYLGSIFPEGFLR